MTPAPVDTRRRRRIDVIDALRGFALLGILLVNVQSFTWGAGNPLGYFADPPASATDQAAYAVLAVLVAGKFYPIFAFLFGVGFALQMKRLQRLAGDAGLAQQLYRRRLGFLLLAGVAHGTLLYYGDVLTAYALCGFMLLLYAPVRPRRLVRAALGWWIAAYLVGLAWLILLSALPIAEPEQIPEVLVASRRIYLNEDWFGQLSTRGTDYLNQNVFSAPNFWPQIVAIFLLGALAGRLGWLRHPGRHPRVWRNATAIGLLIGLPCAITAGLMQWVVVRDTPGGISVAETWLAGVGSWLAAAYVAAFVRGHDHPALRVPMAWLATAGRMPLTSYLTQSLVMGALLSGWGLALGDRLDHLGAALLALAIYAVQVVVARLVMQRWGQGPVEWLWRRWTYAGVALPAAVR